ncbi:hypothetical protein DFH07DRAFT_749919 [Mycena maculata]|uniref:Uncharacterized protein n=1 Tax=Mycena maculata TaxID=230809 RepID=A0AAD7IJX5_9AGAR|nr:hypothetical protein DFH07DRAFT_749919 [Mycena maculata]
MLLSWICVAALTHLAAASAVRAPHQARVTVPSQTCISYEKYVGIDDNTLSYSPGCADVTYDCLRQNGTSIWSHQACVAAATCQGTTGVITLNQCQNPNVLEATDIPNLAFTIYTNIVGSCAPDGCPITQQNYIDFIYGAMSAANVTEWPTSSEDVITGWWQPILDWTATGDTIPYTNFNDWLHYSNS